MGFLRKNVRPGTLLVAWDPNTDQSIQAYTVYWGSTSGVYPNSKIVASGATTATLPVNTLGPVFVVVKALNFTGQESVASAEISGRVDQTS